MPPDQSSRSVKTGISPRGKKSGRQGTSLRGINRPTPYSVGIRKKQQINIDVIELTSSSSEDEQPKSSSSTNTISVIDLTGCDGPDGTPQRGEMSSSSVVREQPTAAYSSNASSRLNGQLPEPIVTPVIFFNSSWRMRNSSTKVNPSGKPEIEPNHDLQNPESSRDCNSILPVNQTTCTYPPSPQPKSSLSLVSQEEDNIYLTCELTYPPD